MRKQYFLIYIFFTLPFLSDAQSFSLGGVFGLSGYSGDLNEKAYFIFNRSRTVAGGFLRYQPNTQFGFRLNMYSGSISGADFENNKNEWRKKRGFSFTSPIKEYSALVEYDILKSFEYTERLPFSINTHVGLGYTMTNPNTNFNEPNTHFEDVTSDKLAQYNRNILVVPIGFSMEWHFSKMFSLGIDMGMRKTFTDYLDGVSLLGQPKLKDWYFLGGVTLVQHLVSFDGKQGYKGRNRVKCPSF